MNIKKLFIAVMALFGAVAASAESPLLVIRSGEHTDTISGSLITTEPGMNRSLEGVEPRSFVLLPGETEVAIERDGNDEAARQYVLLRKTEQGQNVLTSFYVVPGESVVAEISSDPVVLTGTSLVEQLTESRRYMNPYLTVMSQAWENKDEEGFNAGLEALRNAAADYIRNNPDSPASIEMMDYLTPSQIDVAEMITDKAKEYANGPVYTIRMDRLRSKLAFEERARQIAEGKPAPDFTLPDANGNQVSLSSLRGKYVMLDFWGTWCGWCIKGIPQMKEQYNILKDKGVEFVSIACGDAYDKWTAALAKYEMPWIQLWSDPSISQDEQVSSLYAVRGYPTKMVIDPKGIIVNITVGEDPDFYNQFDTLLKAE